MSKKDYFHFIKKETKAQRQDFFKVTLSVSWGRTDAQGSINKLSTYYVLNSGKAACFLPRRSSLTVRPWVV